MQTYPSAKPLPVAGFAAATLLLLASVILSGPELGGRIALEDGPLEYLQALFYAAGLGMCLWTVSQGRNRFMAVLWAFLCFVFLGEETSWFQRVFDYSVPAVESMNGQGEFNLHNLSLFDTGRLLSADRSFSLSLEGLMNSQNIFRAAFFIYFLVLPLAYLIPRLRIQLQRLGYVAGPPLNVLAVAWSLIAVSLVFTTMHGEPVKFYISEVRESVYAAVIFLYTLAIYATRQPAGAALRR